MKKNAALPSPNHSNTFRHIKSSCGGRTEAEKRLWREELLPEEKKKERDRNTSKRRRKMDPALTSTPAFRARQNHGDKINTSPITISPFKMFDISRDLVDPDAYLSMETSASSGGGILKRTHMSDDLSRLLLEPRNENESQELIKILRQTLDLTRAAMERGMIRMCHSDLDLRQPLLSNVFRGADGGH